MSGLNQIIEYVKAHEGFDAWRSGAFVTIQVPESVSKIHGYGFYTHVQSMPDAQNVLNLADRVQP